MSTRALVVTIGCAWEPVRTLKYILAPVSFQASHALSTARWSVLVSACLKTAERLVETEELSDLASVFIAGGRELLAVESLAMSLFKSIEFSFAPVISIG